MDIVKVIPKISKGIKDILLRVELFFPEYEVNQGMIACWAYIGQHGEAGYDYYNAARNPRNSLEEAIVAKAIAQYEKGYGVKCLRVKRQSDKMRSAAWIP